MIEISKHEIRDFCNSKELCARIVDIEFDLPNVQSKVKQILSETPAVGKDAQAGYKALGLQYFNPEDRFYDCVASTRYINDQHVSVIESQPFSDWKQWNEQGLKLTELFHPVYDLGLALYRTRLLEAEPKFQSVTHIDYDWRYHVPIYTNEKATITFMDEVVHMPADGHPYLINAGFMHNYQNNGDETRVHFCGILSLPNEGDGLFDLCLKNGNKEKLYYEYTV